MSAKEAYRCRKTDRMVAGFVRTARLGHSNRIDSLLLLPWRAGRHKRFDKIYCEFDGARSRFHLFDALRKGGGGSASGLKRRYRDARFLATMRPNVTVRPHALPVTKLGYVIE